MLGISWRNCSYTGWGQGDRGQETGRKGGWEVGFPRWQEAGEKGKNYATLHNILQLKKCRGGANKYRAVTGIKGYGKQEIYTLFPPPPPYNTISCEVSGWGVGKAKT